MLYITYKKPKNIILTPATYFDNMYMDDWFEDAIVKQMILDVDKSTVISCDCVRSPILGTIPITKISGGVKALILMYKCKGKTIWATACGDNCAEWIIRLSEKQDVYIMLEHIMKFPRDFDAVCLDNKRVLHTVKDYLNNSFDCLA